LIDAGKKAGGRPLMVIMVAPPGAGKSSLTGECAAELEALGIEVVSTDACVVKEWESDPAGKGLTYEKAYSRYYGKGSSRAERRVDELCETGSGVLVDKCNLSADGRESLIEMARASGMYSVCCVLPVTAQECAQRNASRGERAVRDGAIWGLCKKNRWRVGAHADKDSADLVCVIESARIRRQ
jgi:predicted kinase